MENPRNIEVIKAGATYGLPTYEITNNGPIDSALFILRMAKGNKEDETIFRQSGFFPESLLEALIVHLESVNIEGLRSKETSVAITHLETAQLWLGKRANDRQLRGVQGTYKK